MGDLERRGEDRTSIDDIARQCRGWQVEPYAIFRGKEDVLVAAVAPALVALARVPSEPDASVGSAGARVGYVLRRTIDVELAHPRGARSRRRGLGVRRSATTLTAAA